MKALFYDMKTHLWTKLWHAGRTKLWRVFSLLVDFTHGEFTPLYGELRVQNEQFSEEKMILSTLY